MLHHFAGPTHSGMSVPAERPRDVEVKIGSQRLAEARGQRSEGQRGPEF